MELAYIDVDDEFSGSVIQKLGERKGELRNMHEPTATVPPVWNFPSRHEALSDTAESS